MTIQEITPEIRGQIEKTFYKDEEGNLKINLGNCRLDFEKDYFVEKFTQKGLKLFWINGTEKVFVVAKVFYNPEYKDFSLFTESWNYIKRLKF
ncbi:MAG: hypothetical protein ABIA74_02690 [bacterium]